MHVFHHLQHFTTVEEGEANLKKAIELRDSMGGNLYWNICNDDVKELEQLIKICRLKELKKSTDKK